LDKQTSINPVEVDLRPWEKILELEQANDTQGLEDFIDSLTPSQVARALSRLTAEAQSRLVAMMDNEHGALVLHEVVEEQAAELIDLLSPKDATALLQELPSDEKAHLLSEVEPEVANAILQEMSEAEASTTKALLEYSEDVAGGIMSTEFLAFPKIWTVMTLLDDFNVNHERYSDYKVQYAFVVNEDETLAGVLPFRNVLLAPRTQTLADLMVADPLSVNANTPLGEVIEMFDKHDFLGIPVIDAENKLIGIVRRSRAAEAAEHRSSDSYLKASGIVGGEELRSMSVWVRARRRLSWLSVNIGLNIVAASVIALYQDTLASVIALAVFLPIISDMSGCSGNQAVAVSIRELTLGLVKPYEVWRVFLKEISVGIMNGTVLGSLLGLVAFLWQGNPYLGLVVGGALMINTIVAVCLGGLIPLILSKMKQDPALASGPLLTTVTDLCGFFFALSFATLALPWITA